MEARLVERSVARIGIEHLRAGVPSVEVAEILSTGRKRILSDIERELSSMQAGRPARNMRIVAANYGEGKSHTLNAVRAMASREQFLVSRLTVSRETPLDRIERVYRKLAAQTYFPGIERPGLDGLLQAIAERPDAVQRLLRFVEANLHPKIGLMLEARLEGKLGDTEPLDGDLSGYFLSLAALRHAYEDNVGRRAPKIERFVLAQAFDYLRLVDEMAVLAGLSGWVILLDEAEMIGRVGRRARSLAYAFLGRLGNPREMPHTYSVVAVASSFQSDLADRLDEAQKLPAWLRERGHEELAQSVVEPIRRLSDAPHLPPLSEEDLAEIFGTIVAAHGAAYGWTPPITGAELLKQIRVPLRERDIKVRRKSVV